ncbi:MAG: biopolymer transporter ExbD [Gammaproteobacteria bacterium]|nr:biopolymer transporter ExbD [Pseudomonadales bacterium]MCP5345270.1 biopolymer transporter ExbD [Pseudomonadales bacterium]
MKKIAGKRKADETNIDLTPMLDVVFILLIFFVVTATFLSESAISAASSESNDAPPPPNQDEESQNILFEIGPNDEIILNKQPRPIIPTQVRSNIDQLKAENPSASVIIQPNNNSSVSTLVMIMDAARQAGMYNISVVEPPARSR